MKGKAGIFVNKLSEVIRKRAMLGVAVFCIAAIATVGLLSQGDNNKDNTPDSFVDLNETPDEEKNQQVVDNNTPDTSFTEQQLTENDTKVEEQEQLVAENNGTNSENAGQQVADNVPTIEEVDSSIQTAENTEVGTEETEPVEETQVLSPQLIAEQLNFDKSLGLLWPVQGEVVIPYSPDHGVFHFTLEQFSTSDAVVLSSMVGAEVKAAAKGVVTAIEEDERTGTTVTLAVGNNTSLVYGQLAIGDLSEGDIVEAGECLGTVAEPTRYYIVEGPNLYFQVLEGEESLDPTLLFPENQ